MAGKQSAGILLYRFRAAQLEVLLGHPGGPFWAKKDDGAWSILKGEFDDAEDPLQAAIREFREETGQPINGAFRPLTAVRQAGGKIVNAWAVEGDLDPSTCKSESFELEWPPRSGRTIRVPEIDRVEWFGLDAARLKILKGQLPLLDELAAIV